MSSSSSITTIRAMAGAPSGRSATRRINDPAEVGAREPQRCPPPVAGRSVLRRQTGQERTRFVHDLLTALQSYNCFVSYHLYLSPYAEASGRTRFNSPTLLPGTRQFAPRTRAPSLG